MSTTFGFGDALDSFTSGFGPFCTLAKAPGYDDLPVLAPPPFSTVTHRVAFGATIFGHWRTVTVAARHYPIVA